MGKEPSPALTMFRCSCSPRTPVTLKKNHLQQHRPSSICGVAEKIIILLRIASFCVHHLLRDEPGENLSFCVAKGAESSHEVGSLVALTVWISAHSTGDYLSMVSLPNQVVTSLSATGLQNWPLTGKPTHAQGLGCGSRHCVRARGARMNAEIEGVIHAVLLRI